MALADGDRKAAYRLAHSVKGMALDVDGRELASLARAMEEKLQEGSPFPSMRFPARRRLLPPECRAGCVAGAAVVMVLPRLG